MSRELNHYIRSLSLRVDEKVIIVEKIIIARGY